MTEQGDVFDRDQWNRPQIPDPETGELLAYDRTSTFAGYLSPPYLTDYHLGWGLTAAVMFPGEAARIALSRAAGTKGNKDLMELVDKAGMNEKRDRGSARHTLVRWALTGMELPTMTRAQRKDLDLVTAAVSGLGTITAVEQPLVCDQWQCAGQADYVGVGADGVPFIADLKTGARYSDSEYGWAVQLVVYARSVAWVDRQRGEPVAATRPRLVIVHAPQDTPGKVDLIEIDPGAAVQLAQRAYAIAEARRGFRRINPRLTQAKAVAA